MHRRLLILLIVGTLVPLSVSCARYRRDRCYLAETRYMIAKDLFEQTGSYQRVAQAMDDEGWAHCEINQFRYRLRKDLKMDGEEYDALFATYEPNRESIDFNPGRVERAVQ